MPGHVHFYDPGVIICITVTAQMSAGIIFSYISAQITCTFFSGRGSDRDIEPPVDRGLVGLYGHTSAAVGTESCKLISFCAGFDRHSVSSADFTKSFAEDQTLFKTMFTPEKVRRPEAVERIREAAPDLIVVAACTLTYVVTWFLDIDPEFGKKAEEDSSQE